MALAYLLEWLAALQTEQRRPEQPFAPDWGIIRSMGKKRISTNHPALPPLWGRWMYDSDNDFWSNVTYALFGVVMWAAVIVMIYDWLRSVL